MISLIVSSPNKIRRAEYIQKYCLQLEIDPLDITIIEKDTPVKQNVRRDVSTGTSKSIGIEEIKYMQKKLFFKPIKSPTKAVVIEDAQLLTTEAQNAMLKVLEEPPKHTIIILSATSAEPLLPTIISRCKIIELEQEIQKLSENEIEELLGFIENLPKMPVGEKFKKAEQLSKDKEKALVWIEKIILLLREQMLKQVQNNQADVNSTLQNLKSFQKTHTLLKTTNVNTRFLLENTLL